MRYYSAKADVLVTRYGTGGSYIGATVSVPQEGPKKGQVVITHNPEEVVVIGDDEFAKYAREYSQLVRDGSLIVREEKDHKVWLQKEQAESAKQDAEREAAEKKAAAEAKAEAAAAKKKS